MPGRLEILDVSRVGNIATDHLGDIAAGNLSVDGIAWLKNVGDTPITGVVATGVAAGANDGISMLEMSLGSALLSPANFGVVRLATGGAITHPITRHYAVAAIGAAQGETVPCASFSVSTLVGDTVAAFKLTWDAVVGAVGYMVYTSLDGVSFYQRAETVALEYLDTTAAHSSSNPIPVTINQAYRASSYGTSALTIGDLDPNVMRPIFYRASASALTSADGNMRRAIIRCTGGTV